MSFTFNLNQAEIDKALAAHVKTLGINVEGKEVSVELVSTRKPVGYTAIVTVGDINVGGAALENKSVAQASNERIAAIKETGADVAGNASVASGELPTSVNEAKGEVDPVESDVDLPAVTPESVGHETSSKSLFG